MRTGIVTLLSSLALAGCTTLPAPDEPLSDFVGQDWSLLTVAGAPVAPGPTLRVETDGHAGGSAGCNRFFSTAVLSGNAVTFGAAGTTRMACVSPARGDEESTYLLNLSRVARWRVEGTTLTLTDSSDTDVLTYAKAP